MSMLIYEKIGRSLIFHKSRNVMSFTYIFLFLQLVMILIGQNDLCKLACIHNGTLPQLIGGNNRPQTAKEFARNIKKGLDVLMKGLPKSLVALILPPGLKLISSRVKGFALLLFTSLQIPL